VWVLRKVRDGLQSEDSRFRPLPWAEYAFDDQLETVLDEGCIGNRKMGALRMDVDSLGSIFAGGLGANYSMSRVATLSRCSHSFSRAPCPSLPRGPGNHEFRNCSPAG
jgi:CRISPR/Cas system-associated protein Cas10 (large subunit of type III CRISPR-Cas system)